MKYKFNDKSLLFKRTEKEDNMLLYTNEQHQLVLNSSGKNILELLPKYSSSEEILGELINIYPEVDKRILESDLYEVLSIFDIYNIICLEEHKINENKISGDIEYKITGDINYKKVSKFIIESLSNESKKYYQEKYEDYYKTMPLRMRFMQNFEYGVFGEKNDEVVSYMSVSITQIDNSSILIVNSLFFKDVLSNDEIIQLICGMLGRILKLILSVKNIFKIRVKFYKCHGTDDEIINILKNMGFVLECTFKNETTYGDMKFYSLFLQ